MIPGRFFIEWIGGLVIGSDRLARKVTGLPVISVSHACGTKVRCNISEPFAEILLKRHALVSPAESQQQVHNQGCDGVAGALESSRYPDL